MTLKEVIELCDQAVRKWGHESQLIMVIEECAELQKACTKFLRGNMDSNSIIEEAVDLELMIIQLITMFPNTEMWIKIRCEKLENLKELLI